MTTRRDIEYTQTDARYAAEIILSTGKVLRVGTEWFPTHWEKQAQNRARLIDDARRKATRIRTEYGVTIEVIRVVQERRTVARVIETTTTSKFDSSHYLGTEQTND